MEVTIENLKSVVQTVNREYPWFGYVCLAGISYFVVIWGKCLSVRYKLSGKRQKKQEQRKRELEFLENNVKHVSHGKVADISKLSTEEIINCAKSSKYTCKEILEVFQCKALEAHAKTNSIIGPLKEANARAEELEKREKNGLLYGLPVSIKDNFWIKGYDSSVGCAKYIDDPATDDSVLVKVLKHQGAIPFVKTNVPQTMLSWETSNPIYGATRHHIDQTRGVGGSSGGEGALIAAGGSVLGIGGDIGGSIRIPASISGITGLKPTHGRLSDKGCFSLLKGMVTLKSSMGPLAKDVDTLVLAMKALLVPKLWELDPSVPPMPFNEELYNTKRPLKIGYYVNDGIMESVPAMRRGVLLAKELLQKHGHNVVEWDIPKELFLELVPKWPTFITADYGKELLQLVENDTWDMSTKVLLSGLKVPSIVKRMLSLILKPFMPNVSLVLRNSCGVGSVSEWWEFNADVLQLKEKFIQNWKENGFDAVICPGFTCPACPLGTAGQALSAATYTSLYNTVNFPGGSVPVSVVTAQDEQDMQHYKIKDPFHRLIKKAMKGSTGLPVNVQVISLPWQEELCLRVMKDLETQVDKKAH